MNLKVNKTIFTDDKGGKHEMVEVVDEEGKAVDGAFGIAPDGRIFDILNNRYVD